MISTPSCWPPVAKMNGARSPDTASRRRGDDRGARAFTAAGRAGLRAGGSLRFRESMAWAACGCGPISIRCRPPGKTVEVRLYPSHVEVRDEGRCIARHERCYERQQQVLDLEHYLDVLERKPGALIGSKPLAAWRQRGLWPESYDRLLEELIHGTASRAARAR